MAAEECWQRTLGPGDTVRLRTTLAGKRLTGPIESIDDRQVTIIDGEDGRQSVPWPNIRRLDLQVGLQREYGKSILLGVGIGLGLGLILPLPEPDICFGESCDEPLWERDEQVAGLVIAGLLTGLIAESQAAPRAPRWERVRLPYQPPVVTSIVFGPTDGQGGAGLRVKFSFRPRGPARTTP